MPASGGEISNAMRLSHLLRARRRTIEARVEDEAGNTWIGARFDRSFSNAVMPSTGGERTVGFQPIVIMASTVWGMIRVGGTSAGARVSSTVRPARRRDSRVRHRLSVVRESVALRGEVDRTVPHGENGSCSPSRGPRDTDRLQSLPAVR